MRRKVLARAVHHKRSIAYLGRSTPSDNFATCEIPGGGASGQLTEAEGPPAIFRSLSTRLGSQVRRADRGLYVCFTPNSGHAAGLLKMSA